MSNASIGKLRRVLRPHVKRVAADVEWPGEWFDLSRGDLTFDQRSPPLFLRSPIAGNLNQAANNSAPCCIQSWISESNSSLWYFI